MSIVYEMLLEKEHDYRKAVVKDDLIKCPYSCLGYIKSKVKMIENSKTSSVATGTLITENLVLTAAHPFYCL